MRSEILEFAEEMERVMSVHDATKGDSWKTCDIGFLEDKFDEEYNEVDADTCNSYELVDVANICMMLWHRLKDIEHDPDDY